MKTVQLLLLAAGLAFAMPSARCRLLYSGMLNLRGGSWAGIKFDEETKDPIFSGRWQQDVSDEPEENELKEIFRSRDHVPKPEDTKQMAVVREAVRRAKVERGELPDERYVNRTEEELKQIEVDELLWFAASQGDVELLRQAIHEGANVSSVDRNQYNQTALHCACDMTAGYLDIVEVLTEHGASVNAMNCFNTTPLHQAAYWAHKEVVVKLLELGADPVAKNAAGMTPLLMADAEWRANSRPLPIAEVQDETKHTCEDPNKGGWGLRLKTPTHRKEVLDILLEAAGNRSYGRGADPLLGGIIFPDPWDEWDEETEFVNPLSRKRQVKGSIPPPCNFLARPKPKDEWNWTLQYMIDEEIDDMWEKEKHDIKACGLLSDEEESKETFLSSEHSSTDKSLSFSRSNDLEDLMDDLRKPDLDMFGNPIDDEADGSLYPKPQEPIIDDDGVDDAGLQEGGRM